MLCGSEFWALTNTDLQRLQQNEHAMILYILYILPCKQRLQHNEHAMKLYRLYILPCN